MNKHDEIAARRALLRHWLGLLRDAFSTHDIETEEALNNHPEGGPITPPLLRLPPVSSDMRNLLLDGIERALARKDDPFRVKEPRGLKPVLDKQGRIDVATAVYRLVDMEKTATIEQAVGQVAKEFPVSESMARDAYYELRGLAKMFEEVTAARYRR